MVIEDRTQSPPGSMLQPGNKVRNARNSSRAISLSISCVVMCFAFMMLPSALASDSFYLEGIGYREQALQQAKGAQFSSESAEGIGKASYAGGTHMFIRGRGLNDNPESNYIMLESHEF